MSDKAPELIWAEPYGSEEAGRWTARPSKQNWPTKYRRADIPWLPEELVERLKRLSQHDYYALESLRSDILKAVEKQT